MKLIETNHQINMTSDHSIYAITPLKTIWMLRVSTYFNAVAFVGIAVIQGDLKV